MALVRGYLLLSVVLLVVSCALAKSITKVDSEPKPSDSSDAVASAGSGENAARTLRAADDAPQHLDPAVPAIPAAKGQPEAPQYEQQILVVRGNPSPEKLNEEIRKALRSLLGEEQSDQVQIRQLQDVDELRRVIPGAGPGPIGVRLV